MVALEGGTFRRHRKRRATEKTIQSNEKGTPKPSKRHPKVGTAAICIQSTYLKKAKCEHAIFRTRISLIFAPMKNTCRQHRIAHFHAKTQGKMHILIDTGYNCEDNVATKKTPQKDGVVWGVFLCCNSVFTSISGVEEKLHFPKVFA